MNDAYSQFANSPYAGYLVASAVVLFTFAALTAIWLVDLWIQTRRDSRARELREQRARRQSAMVAATGATRKHSTALAFRRRTVVEKSEADRRAQAIGVDDDFAQWAERSR